MKLEEVDKIEILKINIEGGEYEALIPFLEKHTICQVSYFENFLLFVSFYQ